jgi:hypothetical protein
MNARKPLPIGPLALALRHFPPTSRRIAILAVALTTSLLAGIALLLLR